MAKSKTQIIMEREQEISELKKTITEKDKLLFAYESVNAPVNPLLVENERLRKLLQRCKETLEPFPIVSDLRSMSQRLREKHKETEVKVIVKGFKKHKQKFRKLYHDIEQALKGGD